MSHTIRVSYCVQCETLLPRRCVKCVKHPDRKPRVVELYGVPEVLATAECGCCVRLRCQRPGCFKTMWRPKKDLARLKNHLCSVACRQAVVAAAKVSMRVSVPCACGCGKTVSRPKSNIKTERVYFSQLHHYAHRQVLKAQARRAEERGDVQALACSSTRCRGEVRDHVRTTTGKMACTYCHARRDDAVERIQGVPAGRVA